MKHLDLFSGIGGFALACQWAGIETIGFVEIDKYCQKVLRKHWPNVPIVEDIRDVERIKRIITDSTIRRLSEQGLRCENEQLAKQGEGNGQIQEIIANTQTNRGAGCRATRDGWAGLADSGQNAGTGYSGNDNQPAILVTAGFPCQPFSVAGKRGGKEDDRYLWPQTIAVIKEIKPEWVLLENVTGIINLALDQVLSDLEGAGYATETLVIPACAVNAWHRRDRVWIVAYSNKQGLEGGEAGIQQGLGDRLERCNQNATNAPGERLQNSNRERDRAARPCRAELECGGEDVALAPSRESRQQTEPEGGQDSGRGSQEVAIADTPINRGETGLSGQEQRDEGKSGELINSCYETGNWWAVEPELGRVAHGILRRVDRLKCLGNAIVPQVAYEIIKVIKEVNNG